jgi:hypothetical protein
MPRNPFTFNGQPHSLAHLEPFTISVTPKAPGAPTFRVLVNFGHHTFTREVQPGDDPTHLYTVDGDVRCFCPIRHGLSANLPDIVQGSNKAYLSEGYNYLFVENLPGLTGPYAVFFTVQRAGTIKNVDAILRVVSAYEKLALPKRLQAITMATLVSKVVGVAPIVRRRKKRRKK